MTNFLINRRACWWLLSWFVGSFTGFTPLRAEDQPPHILFIAVDDLNDWLGCMGGHPQAKTPHIDRLAQRGVLFTNAHCAAPVCLASRTAVLSGRLSANDWCAEQLGYRAGKSASEGTAVTSATRLGWICNAGSGQDFSWIGHSITFKITLTQNSAGAPSRLSRCNTRHKSKPVREPIIHAI